MGSEKDAVDRTVSRILLQAGAGSAPMLEQRRPPAPVPLPQPEPPVLEVWQAQYRQAPASPPEKRSMGVPLDAPPRASPGTPGSRAVAAPEQVGFAVDVAYGPMLLNRALEKIDRFCERGKHTLAELYRNASGNSPALRRGDESLSASELHSFLTSEAVGMRDLSDDEAEAIVKALDRRGMREVELRELDEAVRRFQRNRALLQGDGFSSSALSTGSKPSGLSHSARGALPPFKPHGGRRGELAPAARSPPRAASRIGGKAALPLYTGLPLYTAPRSFPPPGDAPFPVYAATPAFEKPKEFLNRGYNLPGAQCSHADPGQQAMPRAQKRLPTLPPAQPLLQRPSEALPMASLSAAQLWLQQPSAVLPLAPLTTPASLIGQGPPGKPQHTWGLFDV